MLGTPNGPGIVSWAVALSIVRPWRSWRVSAGAPRPVTPDERIPKRDLAVRAQSLAVDLDLGRAILEREIGERLRRQSGEVIVRERAVMAWMV